MRSDRELGRRKERLLKMMYVPSFGRPVPIERIAVERVHCSVP